MKGRSALLSLDQGRWSPVKRNRSWKRRTVALGVADQVAVAAIRLRGVIAAIIDRLLDDERKIVHDGLHVIIAETAD